jgi:hypothetical protein
MLLLLEKTAFFFGTSLEKTACNKQFRDLNKLVNIMIVRSLSPMKTFTFELQKIYYSYIF